MQKSKSNRKLGALAVLLIAPVALVLSGCPALMVPSLAYQGLKSNQQGSSSTTQSSSSRRKSSTPANDNSIE